jgi:hypothetical protein
VLAPELLSRPIITAESPRPSLSTTTPPPSLARSLPPLLQVIVPLEHRINQAGQCRVRFSGGWLSKSAEEEPLRPLLVPTDTPAPAHATLTLVPASAGAAAPLRGAEAGAGGGGAPSQRETAQDRHAEFVMASVRSLGVSCLRACLSLVAVSVRRGGVPPFDGSTVQKLSEVPGALRIPTPLTARRARTDRRPTGRAVVVGRGGRRGGRMVLHRPDGRAGLLATDPPPAAARRRRRRRRRR